MLVPPFTLQVVLPIPYNARGVSYTCGEIIKGMSSSDFQVNCITPRANQRIGADVQVTQALPAWARWPFPYRFVRSLASARLETVVRNALETSTARGRGIAYLWPELSIPLVSALRRNGIVTIREAVNCHRGSAKRILDEAYARAGLAPTHGITDESVEWENELLNEIDYVFCPNSKVSDSMLANGVPERKLLSTSYGWSPSRLAPTGQRLSREKVTFVFVGLACIRKGAHLLLENWVRAGIKGQLLLVGNIEPSVEHLCKELFQREDIIRCGYVDNIAEIYHSADVFVFPTLEEGGPQVTYEAAGCGLPVVTTPMGAGRVIQHEINGYILDPYDSEAWVETLRKLSDSPELRRRLGSTARESARQFTWSAVGQERRRLILQLA